MNKRLANIVSEIPIAFIITRGRSGSTLLQSMLDSNTHICAPIESKFVLHLFSKYKNETNWTQKKINVFITDLYTNRKFRLFWNVTRTELHSLFAKYTISSFADACKVIYLSHHSMFTKTDIKLIVDKNPYYAQLIPFIKEIFPEAKFIHLIRDPRAVVYSTKKAFNNQNLLAIANSWVRINRLIELEKLDSNFITIKYEDLVNNPEISMERLCDFLEIQYNKDMLQAYSTISKNMSTQKYLNLEHHRNIAKKINPEISKSWEKELKVNDIKLINYITAETAKKYNYTIEKGQITTEEEIKIIESVKKRKIKFNKVKLLFSLPFFVRKLIFNVVSLFYDKKYKS
jgi:hypothetical protein